MALAVGPGGAVQVAYTASSFGVHRLRATLRAASGTSGRPLPAPVVLARGGRGVNSGRTVVAAVPAEGGPIVAWLKPGDRNEEGGTLEVFAGGGQQVLAASRRWSRRWRAARAARRCSPGGAAGDEVHAATRPQAGGPFGPGVKLADGGSPSVAMTPAGEAIALWRGGVAFNPPD